MTKKNFVALADVISSLTVYEDSGGLSNTNIDREEMIQALARFCQSQNPNFNRERWLAYIAGECGPNGEKVVR